MAYFTDQCIYMSLSLSELAEIEVRVHMGSKEMVCQKLFEVITCHSVLEQLLLAVVLLNLF